MQGVQDMLIQYLQLVVGFNTSDQSLLITVLGAANLLVQVSAATVGYFIRYQVSHYANTHLLGSRLQFGELVS